MFTTNPYSFFTTEWNSLKLDILDSSLLSADSSWFFPNVISSYNRLYFMLEGDAYLTNEQGRWPLRPGYMYLIPANSCYTYYCDSHIHKFYLHFNLELFPGTDLFSYFDTFHELPLSSELLHTILSEVEKDSFSGLFRLKSILWDIIFRFYLQGTKGTDYIEHFEGYFRQKHVLNYLSEHLDANLLIPKIAEDLNIPVHSLSRTFRKDTGHSLKEYINKMLYQKACNLLLHTDTPIYEIAEALGFSDPYYFSRFFKNKSGISPRSFRKYCC